MREGRTENLINPKDRTSEELREMTRKGGIASGIARRKKKTMKEALSQLLYDGKLNEQTKQMLRAEGIDDENMTHQMVITRSLIAKAEAGDVQAYNTICAMIGEKPADKVEVGGVPTELVITMESSTVQKFPSKESEIDLNRQPVNDEHRTETKEG
jgi:hypothetical protein